MVYEGFYQVCCTFLSLLEWGAQPELRAAEQIPFWGWQTAAAKNPAVGFYFWIKQSENLAIPFCNEVCIVSNCSFLVVPPMVMPGWLFLLPSDGSLGNCVPGSRFPSPLAMLTLHLILDVLPLPLAFLPLPPDFCEI